MSIGGKKQKNKTKNLISLVEERLVYMDTSVFNLTVGPMTWTSILRARVQGGPEAASPKDIGCGELHGERL